MLDVVGVLEELGSASPFESTDQLTVAGVRLHALGDRLDALKSGSQFAARACLIIAPDGGGSESTEDQPQQDDNGNDDGNDGDEDRGDTRVG